MDRYYDRPQQTTGYSYTADNKCGPTTAVTYNQVPPYDHDFTVRRVNNGWIMTKPGEGQMVFNSLDDMHKHMKEMYMGLE